MRELEILLEREKAEHLIWMIHRCADRGARIYIRTLGEYIVGGKEDGTAACPKDIR